MAIITNLTEMRKYAHLDPASAESIRREMLLQRMPYEAVWRACAEFNSPSRYVPDVPTERNPARRRSKQILDSTARLAIRTFVAGMMNGATSRARPWWTLTPIEDQYNSYETQQFLHKLVSTNNKTFEVSNLYNVLPMSYKDLAIFSNSAYGIYPDPKTAFYFRYFPVGSYCLGTDSQGNPNQFQFDVALSVRQVVELYGNLNHKGYIDWAGMDPYVAEQYKMGNYHNSVILSTLIMPNPHPKPDSLLPEENGKYVSYTWVRAIGNGSGVQANGLFTTGFRYTNQKENRPPLSEEMKALTGDAYFIEVKAFDYFPIIANRWEVAPNGDYGIEGPAELCLGETLSLQVQERERQEAIAKIVRPAMKGPSSLKRVHASTVAGSMTYVDELTNQASFTKVYDVDPRLNELMNSKVDYQNQIRKSFFEDIFLMMANEEKISHVTAAEINERASEKLVAIGPALGQLDRDQNSKLIEKTIHLNYKVKGRMPEVPEYLKGAGFQPEYISILAMAQKASMISAQDNFTNYVAAISNVTQNPTVIKLIKPVQMIRERAEFLGVNPSTMYSDDEYNQIVQADAERAAQAQQQATMANQAQTAETLSKAKASPDNLLGQYQQMGNTL